MNKIDEIALRVANAYEALLSLDDFARMDIGVDAIGPRRVLEQFIAGVEAQQTRLAELSKDAEPSCIVSDTGIIQNVTDRPLEPGLKLFTRQIPANTAEIEQRVAEDFVTKFKRHVGGDGEFWLHELECFCEDGKWREYL